MKLLGVKLSMTKISKSNPNYVKKRVSLFVLYNQQGKILLQHRDMNAQYFPGYWGFFGGGIEKGESPEEALKREAFEELQLKLDNVLLFKRYESKEDSGFYERFLYLIPTNEDAEKLREQQREGDGIGFFSQAEVEKIKINPQLKFIFKDIFDNLHKKL